MLVDFRLATAESQAHWESCLEDLFRHGRWRTNVRLIVTDGNPGLVAAIAIVSPARPASALLGAPAAQCGGHAAAEAPGSVPAGCSPHRSSRTRPCGRAALSPVGKRVADGGYREQDLAERLDLVRVPPTGLADGVDHNAIGWAFRGVYRRIRSISCFQSTTSCERIIDAVISHLNQYWSNALPIQSRQSRVDKLLDTTG